MVSSTSTLRQDFDNNIESRLLDLLCLGPAASGCHLNQLSSSGPDQHNSYIMPFGQMWSTRLSEWYWQYPLTFKCPDHCFFADETEGCAPIPRLNFLWKRCKSVISWRCPCELKSGLLKQVAHVGKLRGW